MPASIGVNLRVTGHCSQGGRKYMEDLFSVAYQQTEDERDLEYAFFGIYDGHGGSEAAAFAKEHLMDSIVKQRQFWSDNDEDILKAIRNGYMLTHLNMWKELEKWPKTVTGLPSTAGTTASVAFIRRGKIYIGHVGDSAIVLGYQKDGSEEWAAKPLTSDHKPESTAEIERIVRCGGKVISKAGVPRVVWNRPRIGHRGPIKKNTPMDEIPFLAVARSLGDLWSYNTQNDEFIVSPDPDVGVLTIDPSKFRCLIFGTDGLWNMISPEGAVNLVQATERHNEAALVGGNVNQPRDWLNPSKSLVDHALERWSNTRMRADNTSVVTLMLDPPGPPRATVLRSRTTQKPQSMAPVSPSAVDGTQLPNKTEETKTDNDGKQMPQNGLTIMTRYSDVDKPTSSSLDNTEKTPLPPCATLDGRFSLGLKDDARENTEGDDNEIMSNYGNPAESTFMARVLNRTQIVNTLSEVFDEIVNHDESLKLSPESREVSPDLTTVTQKIEKTEPVPSPEAATLQATTESDVSIQINEVSSSSPTENLPKRGRRPKAETKRDTPAAPNDRVLRSHDADNRPQTRQSTTRARPAVASDRVVILSRRVPHTTPAPPPRRSLPEQSTPPEPVKERSTRSQQTPLTQKITRSLNCMTRGATLTGNSSRAPGPVRRAPAARREARSKENLGTTRRRVRNRGVADVCPPRPQRRDETEVDSTTEEPCIAIAVPPTLPPRALRSRNDAECSLPANKRPRCEEPPVTVAKPARTPQEKVVRALSKRASSPWAPALALRNRLRRRLAK